MPNHPYQTIKTPSDAETFQEVSNGLHDGYITHVDYRNNGISACDNCLYFDYAGRSLILHVLVTSLRGHPTFEILFSNILEWQIRESHFCDMVDFSILFLEDGSLLWADDTSSSISDLKQGSYVIAESIQYRQL